jgi:hypothetical protein
LVIVVVPLASYWGLVGAAAADAVSAAVLTAGLLTTSRLARQEIRLGVMPSLALPIPAACVAALLAEQICGAMPIGPLRLVFEASAVFTTYLVVVMLFGGRESLTEMVVFLKGVVTHRAAPAGNQAG